MSARTMLMFTMMAVALGLERTARRCTGMMRGPSSATGGNQADLRFVVLALMSSR